ncbi:MAG: hypothetical protein JWO67_6933 [Streptosporangiaceae bacterium]|nr:hypothetical protein [Streptosporangiaceae bacterium]
MNVQQLATLVVFLGMVAAAIYLVAVVVPGQARLRMIIETSKVRSALRDMIEDDPTLAGHSDIRALDDFLGFSLRIGRPPGMSVLLVGWLRVRREAHAGSLEPSPRFRGLSNTQRLALYLLGHRASMELVRASILGSRLWFLSWPAWLYLTARVRGAETLRKDSGDDRELGQVLSIGSHFDPPALLHA